MGIPELLEASIRFAPVLLEGKPNHDSEGSGHNPARDTWTSREIGAEELDKNVLGSWRVCVRDGQLVEIDHVREDMDNGEEDDRPCDGFVERDVLVERNDVVEWCTSEERDEVPAHGQ